VMKDSGYSWVVDFVAEDCETEGRDVFCSSVSVIATKDVTERLGVQCITTSEIYCAIMDGYPNADYVAITGLTLVKDGAIVKDPKFVGSAYIAAPAMDGPKFAESELREEELNAITGRRSDLTAQLSKTQDALERMRANVEIAGGDSVLSDDPQTFYAQITMHLKDSGWVKRAITEYPEGTMWDKWYKDSDTYYVRRNLEQYNRWNMPEMFDAAVSCGLATQDKPVYRWVK